MLGHATDDGLRQLVTERLLAFWAFFKRAAGPAKAILSIRDLLNWVHFITTTAGKLGTLAAYAHGAHLVLLDGIGLGIGLPTEVWFCCDWILVAHLHRVLAVKYAGACKCPQYKANTVMLTSRHLVLSVVITLILEFLFLPLDSAAFKKQTTAMQ